MTHRFEHLRVRLVGDDDLDLRHLEREFPTVTIERTAVATGIVVDDYVWRGAFDLRSLDDKVERAGANPVITVRGHDAPRIACEVLTRYQRFILRRNDASNTPLFDDVLRIHEGLHDLSLPLAKADLDHAVDVWQWMLRLNPEVSLAPQLAALFHDIERLESETRERIEHRAPDYQSFKEAHAMKGAERAFQLLTGAGVKREDAERVRDIVSRHERRVGDAEMLLLNDADALSFFSLNSSGYVDYFGVAQTRRKVAYTLARLGPHARKKLDYVRLRPDVERLFHEVAA
ncbi:MAG TPA: DUF4202 family protein [Labilithrix sp.]|nr:DUF4202 family protein [Labilithrix sp.]